MEAIHGGCVAAALERSIRAAGMRFMVALHHAEHWWFYPHWRRDYYTGGPEASSLYGEQHNLDFADGAGAWHSRVMDTSGTGHIPRAGHAPSGTIRCDDQRFIRDPTGPFTTVSANDIVPISVPYFSCTEVAASDLPAMAQEAAGQWTGIFNPPPLQEADFLRLYEMVF